MAVGGAFLQNPHPGNALGRSWPGNAEWRPGQAGAQFVVGDVLKIRTEHGDFEIEVRQPSESRGPAPVAALLYQETEASIQAREREQLARQMGGQDGYQGKGRPTKRDRRRIGGVGFGD